MTFTELPTGEAINVEHVVRLVPLSSGDTRVYFTDGTQQYYPEEHAGIIRKAVVKTRKKPAKEFSGARAG